MPLGATRREQIMVAVLAKLSAADALKPAGLTVIRGRRRPTGKEELPMLMLYAGSRMGSRIVQEPGEEVKPLTNRMSGIADRILHFVVVGRALGGDTATDPLTNWTVRQVLQDRSLGGLAIDVYEVATDWEGEEAADAEYDEVSMLFAARYTSARGNLEAAA